jgi:hypothetical protein
MVVGRRTRGESSVINNRQTPGFLRPSRIGDLRVLCVFARIVAVGHRVNAGITSLANSSSDSREAAKTT